MSAVAFMGAPTAQPHPLTPASPPCPSPACCSCPSPRSSSSVLCHPLQRLTAYALSAVLLAPSYPAVAWSAAASPAVQRTDAVQEIASTASFLDLGNKQEKDPVEPFTLFGTTFKKYVIEVLEGNKITSRRQGFTVDTCVTGYSDSEGSPRFNAMPTREKVQDSPLKTCIKVEAPELKDACVSSCQQACREGLDKYAAASDGFTGFAIPQEDKLRVARSCSRSCTYECTKPGKAFDFVTPYRR